MFSFVNIIREDNVKQEDNAGASLACRWEDLKVRWKDLMANFKHSSNKYLIKQRRHNTCTETVPRQNFNERPFIGYSFVEPIMLLFYLKKKKKGHYRHSLFKSYAEINKKWEIIPSRIFKQWVMVCLSYFKVKFGFCNDENKGNKGQEIITSQNFISCIQRYFLDRICLLDNLICIITTTACSFRSSPNNKNFELYLTNYKKSLTN